MNERATDPKTGISLRFIRGWKPEPLPPSREQFIIDMAIPGCSLGLMDHTFVINVGEPRCNICGRANPDVTTP